ncbi:MAG: nuclear transport factor 2 family protein [Candidatus Eremiobacteraeota bacterium]|nr:nuclear transport factor 2 family protein [Candidatus Eremiobacteraeota bacterium]
MESVWVNEPYAQLNNPLGGVKRGLPAIMEVYDRIFNGPARAWVEFYDIVEFRTDACVVLAGRERGEVVTRSGSVPLDIRTTRVFVYSSEAGGWRQIHHHGSIDDLALLDAYRIAVSAG